MYNFSTSLLDVKGIGEKTFLGLEQKGISTVQDLLLSLPLHYLDRSQIGQIKDLTDEKEITFIGEVTTTSNFFRRPRSIQSATVKDETGRIKLMWFNNKFILKKLQKGQSFLISGKLNKKGTLVHPQVEDLVADSIHTGRIVPVYSGKYGIQIGKLRRVIKGILDDLEVNQATDLSQFFDNIQELKNILKYLHFPETKDQVVQGKERLALEELLVLIQTSNRIKKEWSELFNQGNIVKLNISEKQLLPQSIPFTLTAAQLRSTRKIITDLSQSKPMNRLLIGDVGSGKTVVAGVAAYHLIKRGYSVALVAPTKILASQHFDTLRSLFPDIDINLLTVGSKQELDKPALYIGTHGVVNRLDKIKPALVIYDEQHRFGVAHRSASLELDLKPHILTMTATPIPRSLMLTIFSHLELSVIDEMPKGRKPVETYLVGKEKRASSYQWIEKLLNEGEKKQVILVCPFIEPSENESFDGVANVTDKYDEISKVFKNKAKVAKLHGRMKKKEQEEITDQLFAGKIDVLVTTPIVEVGVDLPEAAIIVIENAERFGLASLHQLRGRVGRRGQQGYCLLFSESKTQTTRDRLKVFCEEKNGMKLAEFDLQNRGAGDIFGMSQSGLDNLKYANWANIELISSARTIYNKLDTNKWEPLLAINRQKKDNLPLAN
ncbi:MAG: ATP-dependent DNA helicase RecG [Candidatus Pacebacteria bacterium]|nr:ATP-dependent DNA helicase RecG [Candidatus Paceibacterota bacterium]